MLEMFPFLELLLCFTMARHVDIASHDLLPHRIQINVIENPSTWIFNTIRHVRRPLFSRLVVFKNQFVGLDWLWVERGSEVNHLCGLLVDWFSDFDVSYVCTLFSELEFRLIRAWPRFSSFVFLHDLMEGKRVFRLDLDGWRHFFNRIVIWIKS